MHTRENVVLTRDCKAIQIPDGNPIQLHEGTEVTITQSLGGTFTVMTQFGLMARVDSKDADALGKTPAEADDAAFGDDESLEERVWAQMKRCYDPEIPVNIVDLGLVYDCQVDEDAGDGAKVAVKMTLTAPGCGMGDVLAQDVRQKIEELPGVAEADIEVVFDPQWNMDMMTEAAKLQLGFM